MFGIMAQMHVLGILIKGVPLGGQAAQFGQIRGQILGQISPQYDVAVQHHADGRQALGQMLQIAVPHGLIGGVARGEAFKELLHRDAQVGGQPGGGTVRFQAALPAALAGQAARLHQSIRRLRGGSESSHRGHQNFHHDFLRLETGWPMRSIKHCS